MIDVLLLTQPDCHFCGHAQEVLRRVGQDYPLRVRRVGLDSDLGQTLATRHGVMFAPGVLVEGEFLSYGRLSERLLRRRLNRLRAEPPRATQP
jgi:hypothetical protein